MGARGHVRRTVRQSALIRRTGTPPFYSGQRRRAQNPHRRQIENAFRHRSVHGDESKRRRLCGRGPIIRFRRGCVNAALNRFEVRSTSAGAMSKVGFASPPASGADLAALLGLLQTQAKPMDGADAESLLEAVQTLADRSNDWYGLLTAAPDIEQKDHLAVAEFIEASSPSRIYGVTTADARVLAATDAADLASQLKAQHFKRTFIQYSSSSPYAAASLYGRAFTVDFNGNRTVITLKFKQEPGVEAETLTSSQAATLAAKHCNVFVNYSNDTAIIQQGVMANGYFFDEVHGTDWLQNDVQTAVYNLFYTTSRVAQTDADVNRIVATMVHRLEQAVANGLIAPGVWDADGFGQLKQGQRLSTGYYVYVPPLATQAKADREARKAPPIQCAIKLAGAVHSAHVVINVNR